MGGNCKFNVQGQKSVKGEPGGGSPFWYSCRWGGHRHEIRTVRRCDYFAAAFLAAVVTSAVAFLTAAVASSVASLPAAIISSTVSI